MAESETGSLFADLPTALPEELDVADLKERVQRVAEMRQQG